MNTKSAYIHFGGDLKDFTRTKLDMIKVCFKGNQSIKHIIESLGVPHTEVNKIMVNHVQKDFSYILEDGDHAQVFPWDQEIDLFSTFHLDCRFILDNHLGKLATYMRILGLNTEYENDFQDDEIVLMNKMDQRILLTRDRRLLMRRDIQWGYCVRNDVPEKQIIEVVDRFNLRDKIRPLNRCLKCNHELTPINKQAIIHRLEPLTKLYYEDFYICPRCDHLYWKGSHYEHMLELIREFVEII